MGFIGMFLCNLILMIFLGANVSDNEAINRELFTKLPLYAIPVMVFIGPIMEELVFRFNLRKVCKNKVCFIIVVLMMLFVIFTSGREHKKEEIIVDKTKMIERFNMINNNYQLKVTKTLNGENENFTYYTDGNLELYETDSLVSISPENLKVVLASFA